MAKVTLPNISSGFASTTQLNTALDTIEAEFNNKVLYRDPPAGEDNQLEADIDANDNTIYNVRNAVNVSEVVNLGQMQNYVAAASSGLISVAHDTVVATEGQTVVSFSGVTYTLGVNNLAVFVNGVRQRVGVNYNETTSNSITFVSGLNEDDVVDVYTNEALTSTVTDAGAVTYDPAGTGAVSTNVESKLREFVSVKDFGAACDGVTNDWDAIQAAQEHLKANGGGTLYFPGFCRITQVFHFYGTVIGAWDELYPEPNEKKITWASNGNGGIVSTITSGDVLRLSKSVSDTLEYKVGFKDFVINCSVNDVVAINGLSQTGISGANHHIDIDNLLIHGIEGVNAIGIDFGTITDSQVRGLKVQGWGTGPYAGVRLEKTDVQLVNCMFVYCRNSVVVGGQLAEACVQAVGCQFLNPKNCHIFWEATAPDSKASASIISASFVGECTHPGSAILGAATPATLDIGSFTFEGCTFDNYRSGQSLWDVTWGGRFSLIGNSFYDAGAGGLSTIKFGQYCLVTQIADGLTIDQTCDSWLLGKVNRFVAGLTSGGGVGLSNTRTYGAGITFPPTAVAVVDPNTLDDYEEGSWTPQLTFATPGNLSVTYGRNVGQYQKIGNTVYVSFTIFASAFTHTTASGALRVTGLPFTVANNSQNYVSAGVGFEGYTKANYTVVYAETVPGQTYFAFTAYGSGQTLAGLETADVPSGSRKIIQGQFHYTV